MSRRYWLTGVLVWTACSAPRTAGTPPAPTCLRDRGGCPPAAELPMCATDLVVRPLAEVLAHAGELIDQEIAVVGPLVRGDGTCTLLGCGNACCNRCTRSLQLGVAAPGEDDRRRRATTLQLFGPAVTCRGDESLQCCPVDAQGQRAVARGVFHRDGPTLAIESTELCLPR